MKKLNYAIAVLIAVGMVVVPGIKATDAAVSHATKIDSRLSMVMCLDADEQSNPACKAVRN